MDARRRVGCFSTVVAAILAVTGGLTPPAGGAVVAAELDDAKAAFRSGQYERSAEIAREAIDQGTWNEHWPRLLIRSQLAVGEYEQAAKTYAAAVRRHSSSLPLRLLGIEVQRYAGNSDEARAIEQQIFQMLSRAPARYAGSENWVAAGRYFADRGEDARKILELFYDRVRANDPEYVDGHIATAELALAKHDYAVAAEALSLASELAPDDPYVAYLTARAWAPSDPKKAENALRQALAANPRHVPSLLMQAKEWIDREQYDKAEAVLTRVEKVNPHEPLLWAYRAVISHVQGDEEAEQAMRDRGLAHWKDNPEVDHVIGRELSRKYRFAEGAAAQRRALEFDPDHVEARFQLAQDLLRLGDDDAGWQLAEWVNEDDAYNVVAYNLMTLHDELKKFRVLRRGNLLVRMDAHEADIYGEEVLDLLDEAAQVLCTKYDVTPDGPVVVEIYPRQQDFAIRTFGLPGGDGFLGVCFGRVITANSPASQGEDPSNWKSVLWHEFCHVVTLGKTNNRMPRWLSEGISVYEERQRDPTWGQRMTPQFRQMILSDDFSPISQLSAAFLEPKTPLHVQLAYYESSLAVEYLIERHGMETLQRILVDLGVGMPINETLERHTGSLKTVDEEFAEFAKQRARQYGESLEWSDENLPQRADLAQWKEWVEANPNNYWGLRAYAAALAADKQFDEAEKISRRILDGLPEDAAPEGTLEGMANLYRQLGDVEQERVTLEKLAQRSADGFNTLRRLVELEAERENWEAVARHAEKMLEVNPLLPDGHQYAAEAAERLDETADAVRPLTALAKMDPVDPARLHYRLAKALVADGDAAGGKRETLKALEEAPRYRDAHALLLQLVETE